MVSSPDFDVAPLNPDLLRPSGALLATQIALSNAIDCHAVSSTGHDATTVDLLVRLELAPDRQLRAVELCRQLQLSPSHISRMLDRAEAAGLVMRGPDPSDRRANLVTITDEGQSVVERFSPRLQELLRRVIFDALSSDEIDALVGLLGRIEAAARGYRPASDER